MTRFFTVSTVEPDDTVEPFDTTFVVIARLAFGLCAIFQAEGDPIGRRLCAGKSSRAGIVCVERTLFVTEGIPCCPETDVTRDTAFVDTVARISCLLCWWLVTE